MEICRTFTKYKSLRNSVIMILNPNMANCFRHDNVQYLEKMKQLVLFIEKNLDEKVFYLHRESELLIHWHVG